MGTKRLGGMEERRKVGFPALAVGGRFIQIDANLLQIPRKSRGSRCREGRMVCSAETTSHAASYTQEENAYSEDKRQRI